MQAQQYNLFSFAKPDAAVSTEGASKRNPGGPPKKAYIRSNQNRIR